MSGESDLYALLTSLSPVLTEGVYVFVTSRDGVLPANTHPKMILHEDEGTTFVLLRAEAQEAGVAFEFPCRMITLNVHSALHAVGFLARITAALAKHDIAVNTVSGFHHDHLFVPLGREKEAMRVLSELAELAARKNFATSTVL